MSSTPSSEPKKRGRKPKVVEETVTTVTITRTIPTNTDEPTEKKTRKKAIPKVVKDLTWATHIGDTIAKAKCLCCGQNDIKMNSFHCGHVIAESAGGSNTVDNLRPVCASCNLSMGTQNMNEFMKTHNFPVVSTAASVPAPPVSIPVPPVPTPVSTSTSTYTPLWNKIRPRGCAAPSSLLTPIGSAHPLVKTNNFR